jgi:hypothetical protein
MIGRTTSTASDSQIDAAVLSALRLKAWRLVDAFVQRSRAYQFKGHCGEREDESAISGCRQSPISCVFHVGFVSIIETPEQLERLRRERVAIPSSTARSRMGRMIEREFVRPIDSTAAKVAGATDGR